MADLDEDIVMLQSPPTKKATQSTNRAKALPRSLAEADAADLFIYKKFLNEPQVTRETADMSVKALTDYIRKLDGGADMSYESAQKRAARMHEAFNWQQLTKPEWSLLLKIEEHVDRELAVVKWHRVAQYLRQETQAMSGQRLLHIPATTLKAMHEREKKDGWPTIFGETPAAFQAIKFAKPQDDKDGYWQKFFRKEGDKSKEYKFAGVNSKGVLDLD